MDEETFEATGALDSEIGVIVLSLLQKQSREKNNTVILVTHNADIAKCADKVIRMKNGKIREIINNDHPLAIEEVEWYVVPGLHSVFQPIYFAIAAAIVIICVLSDFLSCKKVLKVKPAEALRPAPPKQGIAYLTRELRSLQPSRFLDLSRQRLEGCSAYRIYGYQLLVSSLVHHLEM